MTSVHSLSRQVSALDINKKTTRSTQIKQPSNETAKLLTKYAAPNVKSNTSAPAVGTRSTGLKKQPSTTAIQKQPSMVTAGQGSARPASPTKKFKPTPTVSRTPSEAAVGQVQAQRGLDNIGNYDGGLERDETRASRAMVIEGEAAEELALDSSVA